MSGSRQSMQRKRNAANGIGCLVILVLLFIIVLGGQFVITKYIVRMIGPMSEDLGPINRITLPMKILLEREDIVTPVSEDGAEIIFTISAGESPYQIVDELSSAGIIRSSSAMIDYLVYTGNDKIIQQGDFKLSKKMNVINIVAALMDPIPTKGRLVILPGWRLEEIAEALPSTGLQVSPEDFLAAARTARLWTEYEQPAEAGVEGFIFPGDHQIERELKADALVTYLLEDSQAQITTDMIDGFNNQGLNVYQAVILASLVQKEAVMSDEMPVIASVFYNRLNSAMLLQTDPTVQYAIGQQPDGLWWKVPLSADDLTVNSPYNTYQVYGLPPTPIASPSLEALYAVAFPETTDYYFFQSNCDGSGKHTFSVTYAEHLEKLCP